MNRIKVWWQNNQKKAISVIITEIFTGFFLAFMITANFGTDPCSFMNLAISRKTGIPFGTLSLSTNLILFAPMLIFSKTRYLGLGTIANMTLIGYSSDLTRYIISLIMTEDFKALLPVRIVFLIIGLAGFIICCAIYMNLSIGLAPYDSIPKIICERTSLPFTAVRMCWDALSIVIGIIVGRHLPNLGNILMVLFLGPTVSFVDKHFFQKNKES